MNLTEFKNLWTTNNSETWISFPIHQVEKSNLNEKTKEKLKFGLPHYAAPFLSFGITDYDLEFNTIHHFYDDNHLDKKTKDYWVFGSDGNGNPICFDTGSNDKIVLLDHEQGFEIIEDINKDISELVSALWLYKEFIEKINSEFGDDGFFDSKFTEQHLSELEYSFKSLNPNYHIEASFWYNEIKNLKSEIE